MGIALGLAILLIIFEGIIIQCEGGYPNEASSSNQDSSFSERVKLLPPEIIKTIYNKIGNCGYDTIKELVTSEAIVPTDTIMSEMMKELILMIYPYRPTITRGIHRDRISGDLFVEFGNYDEVLSFFAQFGSSVRKILLQTERGYYDVEDTMIPHNKSIEIIKKCAEILDELRIICYNDREIWDGLSNEKNDILFPEIKKFHFDGRITLDEFKINKIFPKLKSFILYGYINDANCLTNVKNLNELCLYTNSIGEHQFSEIFENNKDMKILGIESPRNVDTMRLIVNTLTKLETLQVKFPGEDFLYRRNNLEICNLTSVTHFKIRFRDQPQFRENLTFDLPNLKSLTISADYFRDIHGVIDFIERFKKLESVEIYAEEPTSIDMGFDDLSRYFRRLNWTISSAKMLQLEMPRFEFKRQSVKEHEKNKKIPRKNVRRCTVM